MKNGAPGGTLAERLARSAANASWERVSAAAREQLETRVLDAPGWGIGVLNGEPVRLVRAQVGESGRSREGP